MPKRSEQITLQREVQTPDGMGGMSMSWEDVGRAWAAVKWIGGGEAVAEGALRNASRYKFTVPASAAAELALTPQDRVLWNGAHYNIREMPRRVVGQPLTEFVAESGVVM